MRRTTKILLSAALASVCLAASAQTYFGPSGVAVDEGTLYTRTAGVDTAVHLVGSTAGGVLVKDGTTSTTAGVATVATGLTTVNSAVATLIQDPTLSCSLVTVEPGIAGAPGTIKVRVWGVTTPSNATPILDSATSRSVAWHASGT
jgi:hypothetical protein